MLRPAAVSRRYSISVDPKAALRNDIESWQGRKFSTVDLDTFDIADLVPRCHPAEAARRARSRAQCRWRLISRLSPAGSLGSRSLIIAAEAQPSGLEAWRPEIATPRNLIPFVISDRAQACRRREILAPAMLQSYSRRVTKDSEE